MPPSSPSPEKYNRPRRSLALPSPQQHVAPPPPPTPSSVSPGPLNGSGEDASPSAAAHCEDICCCRRLSRRLQRLHIAASPIEDSRHKAASLHAVRPHCPHLESLRTARGDGGVPPSSDSPPPASSRHGVTAVSHGTIAVQASSFVCRARDEGVGEGQGGRAAKQVAAAEIPSASMPNTGAGWFKGHRHKVQGRGPRRSTTNRQLRGWAPVGSATGARKLKDKAKNVDRQWRCSSETKPRLWAPAAYSLRAISGDMLYVAIVGDSRAVLVRQRRVKEVIQLFQGRRNYWLLLLSWWRN